MGECPERLSAYSNMLGRSCRRRGLLRGGAGRMGHIERLRLGTTYPDVVAYVGTLLNGLPARPRPPALVVDATGVGKPVVDMLRAARLRPVAVTVTGGNFSTEGFAAELSEACLLSPRRYFARRSSNPSRGKCTATRPARGSSRVIEILSRAVA